MSEIIVTAAQAGGTVSAGISQIISSGGTATKAEVLDGGVQIVSSAGRATSTTLSSGGIQRVESGGLGYGGNFLSGATQAVEEGGSAQGGFISLGAVQTLASGATATKAHVRGGSQLVNSGATAVSAFVSSGIQHILAGGTALNADVKAAASQTVEGLAMSTVLNGRQHVLAGGSALNTSMQASGVQTVEGYAYITVVNGSQAILAGGTAEAATLMAGGVQTISAGGMASRVVISSAASQIIEDSGVAVSGIISSGGFQVVKSGATAWDTVFLGGSQILESGGTAAGGIVSQGASQIVSEGAVALAGMLSGGTQFLESGATAVSMNVGFSAKQVVSGGAVSVDGIVLNGGTQFLEDSAVATNTVVSAGAYQYVSSGGTANVTDLDYFASQIVYGSAWNTTVSGYASMWVRSGGTASGAQVLTSAVQYVGSNGEDYGASVSGTSARQNLCGYASGTVVQAGGAQHVSGSAANAVEITVSSGGQQHISSGAVISGTTVLAGGIQTVSRGGEADNAYIAGSQTVKNAGTAVSAQIDGGKQAVSAGGTASGGSVWNSGRLTIYSGGSSVDAQVLNAGSMVVSRNGKAAGTVVQAGGREWVVSLGFDSGALVSGEGARQDVRNYGSTVSTVLSAGGMQHVSSGARVQATQIKESGEMHLSAGVAVTSVFVSEGGSEIISSGAKDLKATVEGRQIVEVGGTAVIANVSGSAARQDVRGTASGTIVSAGGQQHLSSGANALNTSIRSAGEQHLSTGVVASKSIVSAYGSIIVSSGAEDYSATVLGTHVVKEDGYAAAAAVRAGGVQKVEGGLTLSTVVSASGVQAVSAGGTASGTKILSMGLQNVSAGGTAYGGNILESGVQAVGASGHAVNMNVSSGGTQTVAGTADQSLVLGLQEVQAGGAANNAKVKAGGLQSVSGTAAGTIVSASGSMSVAAGGQAAGTKISAGGRETVLAGGSDFGAVVYGAGARQDVESEGYASGTVLSFGGQQHVSEGAVAEATDIRNAGEMHLSAGALGSGIVVSSGGSEIVHSGASDSAAQIYGSQIVSAGGAAVMASVKAGGTVSVAGISGAGLQDIDAELAAAREEHLEELLADPAYAGMLAEFSAGFSLSNLPSPDALAALGTAAMSEQALETYRTYYSLTNDMAALTGSDDFYSMQDMLYYLGFNLGNEYSDEAAEALESLSLTAQEAEMYGTLRELQQTCTDMQYSAEMAPVWEEYQALGFSGTTTPPTPEEMAAAGMSEQSLEKYRTLYNLEQSYMEMLATPEGAAVEQKLARLVNLGLISSYGETPQPDELTSLGVAEAAAYRQFWNIQEQWEVLYNSDALTEMESQLAQGINVQAFPDPSAVAALAPDWLSEQSVQSYRMFFRQAQSLAAVDFSFTEETGVAASAMVSAGGRLVLSSGGAAVSGLIMAGGSETVLSGGIDCGTLVSGTGARQNVMSGGSALLAAVSAGGQQHIHSGADVSATRIGSAGEVHLDTGVTVNAFHVSAYGSEVVSTGAQDAGAFVEGFQILRGGAASSASVLAGGVQRVEAGGRAADTEVLSGGLQDVQSSGSAVNTFVGSAGILLVSSGGAATNATVAWGGIMGVAEGGSADGADLDNGSVQLVLSGGSEMETSVKPGSVQIVCAAGSASGTKIEELYRTTHITIQPKPVDKGLEDSTAPQQGGVQLVLGDANVGNASVGALAVQAVGCSLDELITAPGIVFVPGLDGLYANPAAQALLTGMDANAPVMPGESAEEEEWIAWWSSMQDFASAHPAIAAGTVVSGGGHLYAGIGAKVSGASILCGSALAPIEETPILLGVEHLDNMSVLFFPGMLSVANGGKAESISVIGGDARVRDGGVVQNISICSTQWSGRLEDADPDAPQQDFGTPSTQDGHGFLFVGSGGTAYGASTLSGAMTYVNGGALASGGAVGAGGIEILDAHELEDTGPAIASGTLVSGAGGTLPDGWVKDDDSLNYHYYPNSFNTVSFCSLVSTLERSGRCGDAIPSVEGIALQYVGSGASAVSAVLSNGGVQMACEGGILAGTQIQSGGTAVLLDYLDSRSYEMPAGLASGIEIHSGGTLSCGQRTSAAGVVQHSGGHIRLHVGPQVYLEGINAGSSAMLVSNGYAIGLELFSGDALNLRRENYSSGGIISLVDITQHSGANINAQVYSMSYDSYGNPWSGMWTYFVSGTNASGAPMLLSGGTASGFIMYSGGVQTVSKLALATEVFAGGVQSVYVGGTAISTVVHSGGVQEAGYAVLSGTVVSSGGLMNLGSNGRGIGAVLMPGGTAVMSASADWILNISPEMWNTVYSGGTLVANSGCLIGSFGEGAEVSGSTQSGISLGAASGAHIASGMIVSSGGGITIRAGGSALGVVQLEGGNVNLTVHAGDSALVSGSGPRGTFKLSGGTASGFTVYEGGKIVASGAVQVLDTEFYGISYYKDLVPSMYLDSGAFASGITVYRSCHVGVGAGAEARDIRLFGASVFVGGYASGIYVEAGGCAEFGGLNGVIHATGIEISSGGRATIENGAISGVVVAGKLNNVWYGSSIDVTVLSGGVYNTASSGRCSGLTLQSGATAAFNAYSQYQYLAGVNSFDGAVVSGGANRTNSRVVLYSSLNIGAGNSMSAFHLQVNTGGVMRVCGGSNVLGSLQANGGAVWFCVGSGMAPGNAVPMLRLAASNTQKISSFFLDAAKAQTPGTWLLASGFASAGAYAWKVTRNSMQLGSVSVGGSALAAKGMEYRLTSASTGIRAIVSVHAGSMLKASGGTVAGTEHSDIFANGAGNDSIRGSDGRDCAVWGTEDWGQDAVQTTSGTMCIVFDGLAEADVTSSLSGSTMTFAKASDASQKITVNGWAEDTHSVVFGGTMTAFDAWKSAASPTTAQTSAARTQVWQKAGLATA